jgi:hypothetical protein
MAQNIFDFIRTQRQDYKTRNVTIVDGLDYNQFNTIRRAELYYNSTFESGNTDSLGREKPFYNIVKHRVTLAKKATDLDVKDIQVESEGYDDYVPAFLYGKENRNWMRDAKFGVFLNEMGKTRPKFGGVLIKKTEHNGELRLHKVPWKDLVTDQTNIMKGVIIERHFYTPSELAAMDGIWDNVDKAMKLAEQNKDEENEHNQSETPGNYIEVFEVHGDLPIAYLKMKDGKEPDEDDWYKFTSQVHIVAGVDNFSRDEDGKLSEEGGVILFSDKEKKSPYKYLSWDEVDGRALGVGVIEDSFEAQVWTNDAKLKERDLMELASKLLFKTTDKKIGKNVLTDAETGDIITITEGKDISPLNTIAGSIPEFKNLINDWKEQVDRVTSTFEANTGESLPSGTPYRLGAILNQEANSTFVDRLEEMGLFVEEIYEDWIMPYLEKKLRKAHTLAGEFTREELNQIDDAYINHLLAKEIQKKRNEGYLATREEVEAERARLKDQLTRTKNRRFLDVPDDYYVKAKKKVRVVITNEQKNRAVILESLSNILMSVVKAPQILQDPRLKKIFNKIMEMAGLSPVEIDSIEGEVAQQAPQMAGQPGVPQGLPQLTPSAETVPVNG